MADTSGSATGLSPWWRHSAILVMIGGFSVLTFVTVLTYTNAPPIPERAVDGAGNVVFTGADIQKGQEIFFKYGLMEHGSLWGHGAYLGPDYSAEYLHRLSEVTRDTIAVEKYGRPEGGYVDLNLTGGVWFSPRYKVEIGNSGERRQQGTLARGWDAKMGILVGGGILTAVGLDLLAGAGWKSSRQYTIIKSWPTVEAEVSLFGCRAGSHVQSAFDCVGSSSTEKPTDRKALCVAYCSKRQEQTPNRNRTGV